MIRAFAFPGRTALAVLSAALIAGAPDVAASQSADAAVARIDSLITAAAARGFSGSILIRSRDRVVLEKGYGYADRENRRPFTPATGLEIGSITKPITLVSVLKLQEQGKLQLSDSLGRFFPSAPPDKRGITLEQVARHRAGFPDIFGSDYDPVTRDWVMDKLMAAPLIYPPGTGEQYSNAGYSLLATVIELVSGKPYEQFAREAVLLPAGVSRIGYVLAGWKKEELAVGYRQDAVRWGTPLDSTWRSDGPGWNLRGNGGMFATARELAAWYEGVFDGKVLGPEALNTWYAIATRESPTVGGRALGHAGGNGIFNMLHVSYIDADTHMTLFSNNAAARAEPLFREFRDALADLARQAKAKQNPNGV